MEIIVPSTTHYSDAWKPFVNCFRKFWSNCQFPLTLITDTKTDPWDGDEAIVVGEDKGWCNNLWTGLYQVESEFILMLQEDFFLNTLTDHAFIVKALKMMMDDDNIACFRLYPCPGADIPLLDDIGIIASSANYRVSCQAAIWRKSDIMEILPHFNTPNQFEIDGTQWVNSNRANRKYLSVMRSDPNKWPIQYYCSAITRGKWNPDAVQFVKNQGFEIDTSRRPTM